LKKFGSSLVRKLINTTRLLIFLLGTPINCYLDDLADGLFPIFACKNLEKLKNCHINQWLFARKANDIDPQTGAPILLLPSMIFIETDLMSYISKA
jgi:hypothetical protein